MDITIDTVYLAQTHVLEPTDPYFRLVGEKDTLIKVHVLSRDGSEASRVSVVLQLDEETATIELSGPSVLPKEFVKEPGKVVHRFDDCFTSTIPGKWIRKGLVLTIQAGEAEVTFDDLNIGPRIDLNMVMFDIHYFDYEDVDWPENWAEEIAIRRPLSSLKVQRTKRLLFPELLIPPCIGNSAIRCSSEDDYALQTGTPFNGKQNAALAWVKALQDAGGQRRVSLFFINIANVHAGGFAEHFYGCSSLSRFGVLHHELGHSLDVEDLSSTAEPLFPYRGKMHGIDRTTTGGYHIGPAWGYDPRSGVAEAHMDTPFFINPVSTENWVKDRKGTWKNKAGEWKNSPVRGGAACEPEAPQTFNMYSDWSVRKMQAYMERRILKWDDEARAFRCWNDWWDQHRKIFKNDGVNCPVEHDVEVYSILVSASAVTPAANFIYPLIGPYRSGLITTFDPENADDRKRARRLRDFSDGWDVCLRVEQGGATKTYMMPLAWRPEDDPTDVDTFQTRALNLPVRDGKVTRAELLFTPDVDVSGLPADPDVLYARDMEEVASIMEIIDLDVGKSVKGDLAESCVPRDEETALKGLDIIAQGNALGKTANT